MTYLTMFFKDHLLSSTYACVHTSQTRKATWRGVVQRS